MPLPSPLPSLITLTTEPAIAPGELIVRLRAEIRALQAKVEACGTHMSDLISVNKKLVVANDKLKAKGLRARRPGRCNTIPTGDLESKSHRSERMTEMMQMLKSHHVDDAGDLTGVIYAVENVRV